MARRKKGIPIHGWIAVDKPLGVTSTQVVGKLRWLLNAQKIGHGGTLDPLASGILPIALGEATKTIAFCMDHTKTYSFTVRFGEQRSTDDAEGEVIATSDMRPTEDAIRAILPRFIGTIDQLPPRFSALKIDGQRAYDLARAGEDVDLAPRAVRIDSLELLALRGDEADFRCVCGKGTYIRSLGRDLAQELGSVGYISALRRDQVGPFTVNNAISLDFSADSSQIPPLEDMLLPVQTVLDDIPALDLNEREAARLKNGQVLSFISRPDVDRLHRAGVVPDKSNPVTALALFNGTPVALVNIDGIDIQPLRVLDL